MQKQIFVIQTRSNPTLLDIHAIVQLYSEKNVSLCSKYPPNEHFPRKYHLKGEKIRLNFRLYHVFHHLLGPIFNGVFFSSSIHLTEKRCWERLLDRRWVLNRTIVSSIASFLRSGETFKKPRAPNLYVNPEDPGWPWLPHPSSAPGTWTQYKELDGNESVFAVNNSELKTFLKDHPLYFSPMKSK